MRKGRKKIAIRTFIKINDQIKYPQVRVLDNEGQNLGEMTSFVAYEKAQKLNLDLVEISWKSNPPLVQIIDYGKYIYNKKKKDSVIKAKQKIIETKVVQVKTGTGEGDLILKAKNISKWLEKGQRVKLDLFLPGRTKYMDKSFLVERMERVLKLLTLEYKITDGPKKSPKGMSLILEKK